MKSNTTTQKFPFSILVSYFPQDADKRDSFLTLYEIITVINDANAERKFYESLNHEANLTIQKF
jgi:hypothetical protein